MGKSLLAKTNEKDFDNHGNVISKELMHEV